MDRFEIGMAILFIAIFSFIVIFAIDTVGSINCLEEKTIYGEVTDSEFFDDYFVLEFNNETRYKISYGANGFGFNNFYDFTVHSKLNVKLSRTTYDGIIFKSDKLWIVESIIKVPSDDYD